MNSDQGHPIVSCPLVCAGVRATVVMLLGAIAIFAPSATAFSPSVLAQVPAMVLTGTGNSSPAPLTSFTGINPANATPPDSHGAVGPTHVVTHINGQALIQDRSGNILASVALTTFWSSLGVTDVFDPKVVFDPYSNRFMAMACAQRRTATSGMLFGVSATSDPTGAWHLWLLDADSSNTYWVDYPNIGMTAGRITLTGNLFSNASDAFGGVNIWTLDKATVLDGGSFASQLLSVANAGGTLVPAMTLDAGETTQYLVRTGTSNLLGSGRLQVYSLSGNLGSLAFSALPFAALASSWSSLLPNAKQLGSTSTIETNDDRLINVVLRNGHLWTAHTVTFDLLTRTHCAIKWWELNPADGTAIQSGLIEDVRPDGSFDDTTGRYYYYPSIAVNGNNEVLIGFSGSGALEYASAYYAFRSPAYPQGRFDEPFRFKAGLGIYTGPRWGDYSATVADTTDNTAFWTVQQYAAGAGKTANAWARVTPPVIDTVAPRVTSATVIDSTSVQITFDESMLDNAALVSPSFYTFTGGLNATSVTRLNASQVLATVNEMANGTVYTVTVGTGGPADLAGNPVGTTGNTANFTGLGVAPTATIGLIDPTPTNLNTVRFSVNFSESVGATFSAADVALTGTLAATSTVSVAGGPLLFTVSATPASTNAEGTIGLTVGTAISDLAGNLFGGTTSPQTYTLDNTAPLIGVSTKTTGDRTPSLAGTVSDNLAVVSISVAGQARTAVNNGNGTWILADNSLGTVADGTYNVIATATDPAGNVGTDGTTNELTVDGTAPAVTVNNRVTNDNTPQITGTINEVGATITVVVGGQSRTATNNGNGTWTLADGSLGVLSDGVYNVAATGTDAVGNAGTDSSSGELTIDTVAPVITVNNLLTNDTTPPLSGTINDGGATISITVGGQTRAGTNGGAAWSLADGSLTALPSGAYNVVATATDAAGNVGSDTTTSELTIDVTAPVITVGSLNTKDTTPALSGTVNDNGATIRVSVGTQSNLVATNQGNGSWILADNTVVALADGVYNVTASARDAAGNTGNDSSTNELRIDTTAPAVGVNPLATLDPSPPLSGTVNDPTASVIVTVGGNSYPATNSGSTWSLANDTISPALAPGVYEIVATATDTLGNAGSDSTAQELMIKSLLSDAYVNGASGNDLSGSGTQSAPWATVAHAIAMVEGSVTRPATIRVAAGVYSAIDAKGAPLRLDSYEQVLGGYEAVGWSRNSTGNVTILDAGNVGANAVVLSGIAGAILDGFTIRGVDTSASSVQDSSGILGVNLDTSSVIRNCVLRGNTTNASGNGGIRLVAASPLIDGCTITENYSLGAGGGIGILGLSSPQIDRCVIAGNEAESSGGGIHISGSANVLVTNSVICNNGAHLQSGGGIYVAGGFASVTNCTIANNDSDTGMGGGIDAAATAAMAVLNSALTGNNPVAIAQPVLLATSYSIENCLFNANLSGDFYCDNGGTPLQLTGATAINTQVPGASANKDGAAQYAIPAGTWSTESSNATTGRTTLGDTAASFAPGSLRGMLLQEILPDGSARYFPILDNSGTTVDIEFAYAAVVAAGDHYTILDFHLDIGSAAIDSGRNASDPADGAVTTDFDGVARGFDGDGKGAITADGSDYDIGAYESDTSPVIDAITVVYPNGGEVISRASYQTLTWTSRGNVGANVKIVARKGTTSATVVSSTPNDGSHDWLVPLSFPTGTNTILEISSVTSPAILDTSDGLFSIIANEPLAGTLTVVAPNGGESVLRGANFPITWSSTGNIGGGVRIYLRRGTTGYVIASSTANDGRFDWIPTYPVGTGYVMEINSVLAPTIIDSSNASFSLTDTPPAASITVTVPNGGETYEQGATIPIAWSSSGTVGSSVQILARGGGQTFTVTPSTSNDGGFNWPVPTSQAPGTDYVIEVRSASTPAIGDSSNAAFTIAVPPSLTLTTPNGGESYNQGDTIPIAWNSIGAAGSSVQILASSGGQTFTVTPSTSNDGGFNWPVPASQAPGADYIIEVRSITTPAIGDSSDAPFTIAIPPSLTVTAPNGGELFYQGATVPIAWNSIGAVGSSVQILARGAGQTFTVTPSTSNDSAYNWPMPASMLTGVDYVIEIRSISAPAVADSSDAAFTIATPPPVDRITVLSPNGGESLVRGTTVEITWSSTGNVGTAVKLVARKGTNSSQLAGSTPNDGSYLWKIPSTYPIGPGMVIEITSISAPGITDSSDSSFTIISP